MVAGFAAVRERESPTIFQGPGTQLIADQCYLVRVRLRRLPASQTRRLKRVLHKHSLKRAAARAWREGATARSMLRDQTSDAAPPVLVLENCQQHHWFTMD
jgi:hypothetical protein